MAMLTTTLEAASPDARPPDPHSAAPRLTRAETRRSAWRTLENPRFRLYFAGSLASNLGTWIQNTAQVLLTYQFTHSVLAVGVVTGAQFAGPLLLGPWSAVLAGRIGGKRMLIGTQLFSASVAGLLAGLQAAGLLGEWLLVIGALGLGLAFALALPVQTALIPRLVKEADTEAAMAMNSVSYNVGRALAPALCVVVIIGLGFAWAFALNAISFMIFAVMLFRAHPGLDGRPSGRARVLDGLSIALQQPRIALLLAIVATVTFADDPVLVLGPALARHIGGSNNWAGYFMSALGFGTIIASLVPTRARAPQNTSRTPRRAALSLLGLAGAIILFAFGHSVWISLLAALAAGVAALLTGATAQTLLVRQRPEQAASIMALWAIAWAGTKPLASIADGWIASTLGVHWAGIILTVPALILGLSVILIHENFKERIKSWARACGPRLDEWLGRLVCTVKSEFELTRLQLLVPVKVVLAATVLASRDRRGKCDEIIAECPGHLLADSRQLTTPILSTCWPKRRETYTSAPGTCVYMRSVGRWDHPQDGGVLVLNDIKSHDHLQYVILRATLHGGPVEEVKWLSVMVARPHSTDTSTTTQRPRPQPEPGCSLWYVDSSPDAPPSALSATRCTQRRPRSRGTWRFY